MDFAHLVIILLVILSSEVGALDIPAEDIVIKDRLRPGKMLLVDTKAGKLIADDDLKESYAHKQPYGEWLESNLIKLKDMRIPNARVERYQGEQLSYRKFMVIVMRM